MKNILCMAIFALVMTSCYNAKVCMGNVKQNDPVVKVNSVTNHNLLWGLIPLSQNKVEAKNYIGNRENYAVKYNWTFLNGFLGCITCGIYSPTTTTFYVPLNDLEKK